MTSQPNTTTGPAIPRSDSDLYRFARAYWINFSDAGYFQPAGTRAELIVLTSAFDAAIQNTTRPILRTPETIAEKRLARKNLITALRKSMKLNQINFRNGNLTLNKLLTTGQFQPKTFSTSEPAPRFAPSLVLVSQTHSFTTLKLIQNTNRGSNTNTRLPKGVKHVELLQLTQQYGFGLIRSFTRPTVRMNLESYAPGSDIVVAARYVGTRSEPGPISQSLTIHIPA